MYYNYGMAKQNRSTNVGLMTTLMSPCFIIIDDHDIGFLL